MHMLYCIPTILFTLNGICIFFLPHSCMDYSVWVCMNISKMCCWFKNHFGFPYHSLPSLWCIFARVFPSRPSTITCFQGAHSSQAPCVRISHAPSLTHYSCHILATNKVILVGSMKNHDQGISIGPTVKTPTPNSLRSNWDFLLGRSPDMLAGLVLSTYCFSTP